MVSTAVHLYNRDQQQQLMKKALSIVSSAALALAMLVPGTIGAQTAKKLVGQTSKAGVAQMKAQQAPAKNTLSEKFQTAKTRQVNVLSKGLNQAYAGTRLNKPGKKAPVKFAEAGNMPTLYGCVIYSSEWTQDNALVGIYNVNSENPDLVLLGPGANYGNIEDDGVFYSIELVDLGFIAFSIITSYDMETGEVIASKEAEIGWLAPAGFVKDPTTGTIYGISYNDEGNAMRLATFEFQPDCSVVVNEIAPMAGNWNSIACDAQGQLYGISYVGETQGGSFVVVSSALNKIDKATGEVTLVGDTGKKPQYLSSAAIDPVSGRMFWNLCPADKTGYLCEVDLTTGEASELFQYVGDVEIMGMYVPAPAAEDGAPAAVTDLAASFVDGSLTGNITFTCPETLYDGTPADGDLTFQITANGETVAEGNCAFGENMDVEVVMDHAGVYKFVVTVANEVGVSPKAKVSTFVGNGIPEAPEDVVLEFVDGVMNLSWAPVTASADGGYINPDAVTYTVTRFPDEVVVAENISATSFSEPFDRTDVFKVWYEVYASFEGVNGAAVSSNKAQVGEIQAPYYNALATVEDLDDFTIIDANGDNIVWTVDTSYGYTKMRYNFSMDMDDWLISPAIKLEAGKVYIVSIDARANSTDYPERIEVKWGKAATVAGMTNDLVAPTDLLTTDWETLGDNVIINETGFYYFGMHGISDADQFYLCVKDFNVSAPIVSTVPGKATDIVVTPNFDGELEAEVSFKAPEVDLAGNPLSSITSIVVKRDGILAHTFDAPAVGEALSFTDTMDEGGNVVYTIQGFNEDGEGAVASVNAFIGVPCPAAPTNVAMTEEGNTGLVTITWDGVTTDFDGNPINTSKVGYIVAQGGSMGWDPITDVMTETTFTVQAVEEGEQAFVQYAVFAITSGGEAGAATPLLAVGTPYDGLAESFEDGEIHYAWATGYQANQGAWSIYTDENFTDMTSVDGDNGFAGMKGSSLESSAGLYTGKIDLANTTNPGVSYYVYNIIGTDGSADINEVQVYVRETGTEEWATLGDAVVIDDLNPGVAGWHKVIVSLEEYAGKVVEVRFQATTYQFAYTFLDMIKVGSQLGNDLTAKDINAPAFVVPGNNYDVNVVVVNNGTQAVAGASVKLYSADAELLATKELAEVASGASVTVAFEQTMSPVAEEPVGFYAMVENAGDEYSDDNTTETIYVAPKVSSLPKVTDLAGECTEEGVVLTWSEPDLSSAPVESEVVDFEDGEAFAMEYAGWTFVDVDESLVGGFQGIDIPGITPGGTTASFFVFDASGDQFNQSFDAHSGTMYLAAMFRYDDGTTDDWAISPALSGDAQTVSFYAKSYSASYPEKIEMYYSMGSTDVADFVQVGNTVSPVLAKWTELTFDVPAGAKYFAIRSCATGSFMLMMDDFTFAAAEDSSAELSIVGYDIYRDGVKINEEPVAETEYVDATAEPNTDYAYQVVVVYDRGLSAPSNVANVLTTGINEVLGAVKVATVKGAVEVTGAAGLNLSVVAADGKVVFNGVAADKETVNVPAGVYVVRVGNKTAKVAVK